MPKPVPSSSASRGMASWVTSAVSSSDGQRVLTASDDNTARIWDAKTGSELIRFEGHGSGVRSAVFSADGQRVVTASDDNTARIWDVRSGKCLRILAPVTEGWLTLDERGRYRAGGRGLDSFSYFDPTERSLLRTLWHPEDLPWMAADYDTETRGHGDRETGGTVSGDTETRTSYLRVSRRSPGTAPHK